MKNKSRPALFYLPFIICGLFTIPIIQLIFFSLKFQDKNIKMTQDELTGAMAITSLWNTSVDLRRATEKCALSASTCTLKFAGPPGKENVKETIKKAKELQRSLSSRFAEVSDNSGMILDPDLDTYYLVDLVTVTIPRMLGALSEDSPLVVEKMMQIRSRDLKRSGEKAVAYYSSRAGKGLADLVELRRSFEETQRQIAAFNATHDPQKLIPALEVFWQNSHESLVRLLKLRQSTQLYERREALATTFVSWIGAIILAGLLSWFVRRSEIRYQAALANSITASRLASLGEMAGGIAHEINNPLAIILLHAQKIRKHAAQGQSEAKDIVQSAEKIETVVEKINRIVKGMRSLSRQSESDPKQIVNLSDIINETMSICNEMLKSKRIKCTVTADGPCYILGRYPQIGQIILNLVSNAVDAVADTQDPWLQISLSTKGHSAQLRITDSGLGVPENIVDKIMNPFFTTKDVGKGTGLGLSVSRAIALAHGGDLQLERGAKNTTFLVEFPLSHVAGASQKLSPATI